VFSWHKCRMEPLVYDTLILATSSFRTIILDSNDDYVSRLLRFTKHLYISGSFSSFEETNDVLSRFPTVLSLSCSVGSAEHFSCLIEDERPQHAPKRNCYFIYHLRRFCVPFGIQSYAFRDSFDPSVYARVASTYAFDTSRCAI
jgi:hypothetical protein